MTFVIVGALVLGSLKHKADDQLDMRTYVEAECPHATVAVVVLSQQRRHYDVGKIRSRPAKRRGLLLRHCTALERNSTTMLHLLPHTTFNRYPDMHMRNDHKKD
jgi:hypothetical protein